MNVHTVRMTLALALVAGCLPAAGPSVAGGQMMSDEEETPAPEELLQAGDPGG